MTHIRFEPMLGTCFGDVADKAYAIVLKGVDTVSFRFNGVEITMIPNVEKKEVYMQDCRSRG
jgi:hypothetical protein